jgi:hypothetical protein
MNQHALRQTYALRTRTGHKNSAPLLNAFRKQAVVQLTIGKIRDVLDLFANNTPTGAGSHLYYGVNKDELFMDGAGI